MSRVSLKKTIINSLFSLIDTDNFKDNHLILTTPVGVISGKPFSPDPDQTFDPSTIDVVFEEVLQHVTSDYFESNTCNESDLSENDGYLFLTDVTVRFSNSCISKHPFMAVFYDHIIGVTLGHID